MYKFTIFLIFVIYSELVKSSVPTTSRIPLARRTPRSRIRVDFGEICNSTVRCKSEAWLACDNEEGRCVCAKQDEMTYVPERMKCVAFIGERCKFGMMAVDGDVGDDRDVVAKGEWFELVGCVDGAVCGLDGVCQCPDHLYEDSEANKCSVRKDIGETCGSNFECDWSKMLTCGMDGKCVCYNPAETDYDKVSCKVKLGKHCIGMFEDFKNWTSNQIIEKNSVTDPKASLDLVIRLQNPFEPVCKNGSYCNHLTQKCSCRQGEYADYDLSACIPVKGIDQPCMFNHECNSTKMLACVGGSCQCQPDNYVRNRNAFKVRSYTGYDYYVAPNLCTAKVGVSCSISPEPGRPYSASVNNTYCLEQGECSQNNGKCRCKSGYSLTSDNQCGKGFNGACSIQDYCTDRLICSHQSAPSTSMTCRCPNEDFQTYDSSVQSCRSHVGTACGGEQQNSCVKNAECVSDGIVRNVTRFICMCKKGYISFGQNCDVAHGYPCNPTKSEMPKCDQVAGLKCRIVSIKRDEGRKEQLEQICSCPNSYDIYDPMKRKCVRELGVNCKDDNDCLTNALCHKQDVRLAGECRCQEGFIPTDNNDNGVTSCQLKLMSPFMAALSSI